MHGKCIWAESFVVGSGVVFRPACLFTVFVQRLPFGDISTFLGISVGLGLYFSSAARGESSRGRERSDSVLVLPA